MATEPLTLPSKRTFSGEIFGGLAAVLVALPSAIAYGLAIYGPLGGEYAGIAVIAGICGTILIGLVASVWGGTPGLISAPCAPAAAVLSVLALECLRDPAFDPHLIPQYLAIVGFAAGLLQLATGFLGGGRIIKYIPYPVIAGYLSGVGLLIIIGQVPKFFGYPKALSLWQGLADPSRWHWQSLVVGGITITVMLLSPRVFKKVPAAIVALLAGIGAYFALAAILPDLRTLDHNKLVIGSIQASAGDMGRAVWNHWSSLVRISPLVLWKLAIPAATLAILLSIDTLKTCVILDVLTGGRHNSNRELTAQGIGNMASAVFCGMPGAGTMGATLVNLSGGGRSRWSGIFEAGFGIAILLLLGRFIAWIPVAALAGILFVVGYRMVDKKSVYLLRHKTTMLDFFVMLAVIVSALSFSLLAASGVGIAMSIVLFLRAQIRSTVIRRKLKGSQIFSKKRRTPEEMALLEEKGQLTTVCELQGELFFGTADQLNTELLADAETCRFVVIDMRRVRSVDYTAANMLKQLLGKLESRGGTLILCSVSESLPSGQDAQKYLRYLGLQENRAGLRFFPDPDTALEWIEDTLLQETLGPPDNHPLEFPEIGFFRGMTPDELECIRQHIELREYLTGVKIFSQNEEGDEIYFIRSGMVKITLPLTGGEPICLSTLQRGEILGEMAFLDKDRRSADALAETPVSLYVLSRQKFKEVAAGHPEIAALLFKRLAKELSQRLRQNNIELKALK
jgi:SulP family sulfate permease